MVDFAVFILSFQETEHSSTLLHSDTLWKVGLLLRREEEGDAPEKLDALQTFGAHSGE